MQGHSWGRMTPPRPHLCVMPEQLPPRREGFVIPGEVNRPSFVPWVIGHGGRLGLEACEVCAEPGQEIATSRSWSAFARWLMAALGAAG